jgi:hypothetical protein
MEKETNRHKSKTPYNKPQIIVYGPVEVITEQGPFQPEPP